LLETYRIIGKVRPFPPIHRYRAFLYADLRVLVGHIEPLAGQLQLRVADPAVGSGPALHLHCAEHGCVEVDGRCRIGAT
jgi:hypothetical protein